LPDVVLPYAARGCTVGSVTRYRVYWCGWTHGCCVCRYARFCALTTRLFTAFAAAIRYRWFGLPALTYAARPLLIHLTCYQLPPLVLVYAHARLLPFYRNAFCQRLYLRTRCCTPQFTVPLVACLRSRRSLHGDSDSWTPLRLTHALLPRFPFGVLRYTRVRRHVGSVLPHFLPITGLLFGYLPYLPLRLCGYHATHIRYCCISVVTLRLRMSGTYTFWLPLPRLYTLPLIVRVPACCRTFTALLYYVPAIAWISTAWRYGYRR